MVELGNFGSEGFDVLDPLYGPHRDQPLAFEGQLAPILAPYTGELAHSAMGWCLVDLESAPVTASASTQNEWSSWHVVRLTSSRRLSARAFQPERMEQIGLRAKTQDGSEVAVTTYGPDIYTEPEGDPDTLANLGPLRPMAGIWEGTKGSDRHPVVEGTGSDSFVENYELHPIDRQTNGPQLFYGLRYHTHITKPGEPETFHDQVGYWLWEPAAQAVTLTLGIPRAQVLLASGPAESDATDFELTATAGTEVHGILSNPFLYQAFRTLSYRIHVTINGDGAWSYEEEGVLKIPGRDEVFRHIDRNTLTRIAPPGLNPLALAARQVDRAPDNDYSLGLGSLRPDVAARQVDRAADSDYSLGLGSLRTMAARSL